MVNRLIPRSTAPGEPREGTALPDPTTPAQPAPPAPAPPRDGDNDRDGGGTQQALSQGEILALVNDWLNGDRTNGLSPNSAKALLEDIGADPNLVDEAVNTFNNLGSEEAEGEGDIFATGVPSDGTPGDGTSVQDLLGGGQGFIGEDADFFTDPAFRGQVLSLGGGGRDQLFNELVAQTSLGAGGAAPFVNTFAERLRNPLETLFRFGQQLPLASEGNIDPASLPNFSSFASNFQGIPGGGAFQDVIDQITRLQGGQGGEGDPFVSGIPDFFRQNPNQAFNLGFGASGISPFNPFADAFRQSARTRFNAQLGQGGDAFGFLQNQPNFFGA